MEDSKIIALYWSRDEEALLQTQKKYGGYCFSIANNILPYREDAEECVNDTYMAAWNALPPGSPSILSAFLGKLTRRISISRWRSFHAEKRGGGNLPVVLDELSECISGTGNPEGKVIAKELAKSIDCFLDSLPEIQRRIFLMRYFQMASIKQIETAVGFGESKVKSMLHRVRCKLREHLTKEGFM